MAITLHFCFISVIGGYVNTAQISRVTNIAGEVQVVTVDGRTSYVPEKSVDAFMARLVKTCGIEK